MGQHYRSDTKDGSLGFLKSMWTSMRVCQWVEPNEGAKGEDAGVLFFRNRNGVGISPAKISLTSD
jgi:omega-6 fatty acid desaturase / acyl-lipid omega-6 desaturase (Delta-12 desaturase)